MSIAMQSFAMDTLLWTGGLIALVLVLRRPVSQHFGAKAAYALWSLPFLRLILPPIVLPAWLAPEASVATATATATATALPLPVSEYTLAETGGGAVMLQPMVTSQPMIDWTLLALAAWLAGAIVFLVRRYALYFAMRRELLRGGSQVGTRGRVRLVETPQTPSPVAFGVIDKVVALPEGFMANTEATRRDLALEHELAHHRAHDLLANALVQPLFALHWFNPLGWIGWRAMRRDQEAACDARVVARCEPRLREQYASTIASFATRANIGRGTRNALAAPMACPVLGDKSIIHRLRSLTMSDISPRRRIAARTLMIGALAALPLTASMSYAESLDVAEPPAPPEAPLPPEAPEPPAAPLAPPAPLEPGDRQEIVFVQEDQVGEGAKRIVRVERKVTTDEAGKTRKQTSYTINGREATAEERAEIEAQLEKARVGREKAEEARREMRIEREQQRAERQAHREARIIRERLGEGSEFRKEMLELQRELGVNGEIQREIQLAMAEASAQMPRIKYGCDGSDQVVREKASRDGQKEMIICERAGLATARAALSEARREIANDRDIPGRERAEALRSIDEAMRELDSTD